MLEDNNLGYDNAIDNSPITRVTQVDSSGQPVYSSTSGSNVAVTSVVPGTGATNLGKAEDSVSADGDTGVALLAVRKATPANTSGTDGDYEFLQVSAGRLWGSTLVTDLVPGTGATNLGKAEDAAHTSGDVGVMALTVRADTAAATAGTTGDYQPQITDATGLTWMREYYAPGYEDNTIGVAKVEQRFSYAYIAAGQAATVVKSGAGFLHTITLNSAASATNVTTIFDNTAGSGTTIAKPAATTATVPTTLTYDVSFSTGLTILTATANGADMTVSFR